jgi:SPP1 gp7 family putative phage head morphogenesis protein
VARDPRITTLLADFGANGEILDRAIRHSIELTRLANGEVRTIAEFINTKILPDLLDKLESRLRRGRTRGFDPGPWTTNWYREMTASLDAVVKTGFRIIKTRFRERLSLIARSEAEWQASVIRSASGPIHFSVNMPAASTLRTVVFSRPIMGEFYNTWWEGLTQTARSEVNQAIRTGIVQGETNDQIVRRLAGTRAQAFTGGVAGKWNRWAAGLVRTQVRHTTMRARQAVYRENEDIIKGERFVATLDARTTEICASLDGRVYRVMEGPTPPLHHQCRSDRIPILRSWKELGINLQEAPPGTRASLSGQVPSTLTYGDWLRQQSWEIQKRALGPTRARAFRMGMPVRRFVDDRLNVLTLSQLRQLEGLPPNIRSTLRVLPGWRPGLPTTPKGFAAAS